jgi:hypothetical protein
MPLPHARNPANSSRSFWLAVLLLLAFIPLSPVALAGSHQNPITLFSNGSQTVELELNSSTVNSVDISVFRNTTLTQASFDIIYNSNDPSPGTVMFNVGEDSIYEWGFTGTGAGKLGKQHRFVDDSLLDTTSVSGNRSWNDLEAWQLPLFAQISESYLSVEFTPTFGGDFLAVGDIADLHTSDMDNDNLPEPVFLVRDHQGSNGSAWPHFAWTDWSLAGGLTTSWVSTCEGAQRIVTGDIDGDGSADVVSIADDDENICVHLSGTNSWQNPVNYSVGGEFGDGTLADMDNDGQADWVYVNTTGHLGVRIFSGGSFIPAVTTMVESLSGTPQIILSSLAIGNFYGGSNKTIAVSEPGAMSGYNTFYNYSSSLSQLMITNDNIECMGGAMQVFDFNQDGRDDLLGPTISGGCSATYDGTQWQLQSLNFVVNNNFSISDYDRNGSVELLIANPGSPDNNDVTFTGKLDVFGFNSTGNLGSMQQGTLTPHTSPRDLAIADLDGDGLPEQIVVSGESSSGLWLAGWHTVEWDLDRDGTPEGVLAGYAGDGNGVVSAIEWIDEGNISILLSSILSTLTTSIDDFAIEWSQVLPRARTSGAGTITQSDLNITYSVTFRVEDGWFGGDNLSYSLNLLMQQGNNSNTFEIPLNFTSSDDGNVTLDSLSITWIPGSLTPPPPAPFLYLDSMDHTEVVVRWTDMAANFSDLIGYQLFRVELGLPFELNQPLAEVPFNMPGYIDSDNIVNSNFTYAVRSMHENEIFSQLSNLVDVYVPDIPPVIDVTPPDAPVVNLSDTPNDWGGSLNLSWIPSVDSDVAYTLIFLETSQYNDATSLTPYANISAVDNTTNILVTGLGDGVSHWAAAVAVDTSDNAWWNVTTSGPAYSFNNSVRSSEMTIALTADGIYDDGTHSGANIHAGHSLFIDINLSSEGEPVSGAMITLGLEQGGNELFSSLVVTNFQGLIHFPKNDWLEVVAEFGAIGGEVTFFVQWDGGLWGAQDQPIASASASTIGIVTVDASLSANPSPLQLDSAGRGDVSITFTTDNSAEQSVLAGMSVEWNIGNATNGVSLPPDAPLIPDSNGATSAPIYYPDGGELTLSVVPPWWLNMQFSTLEVVLLPPPQGDDVPNEPGPDPELQEITVSCVKENWTISDDARDVWDDATPYAQTCTFYNPNNTTVWLAITTLQSNELPAIAVDLASIEMVAATDNLTFIMEPTFWSATFGSPSNGTIDIDVGISATDWGPNDVSFLFSFTMVDEGDDNSTGGTTELESGGLPTWLFALIVLALIAGIGVVAWRMVIRGRDEEDSDEEDWLVDDLKGGPPTKSADKMAEIPTGRSLEELTTIKSEKSGKKSKPKKSPDGPYIPTDQDEFIAAPVRSGEMTWDDDYDAASDASEDDSEGEWDYTKDEDYHVDPDGVEWWKDEVGVWWYKYPDEEDWESYE